MFKQFTEIVMKNSILFGISVAVISAFVNELLFSFINDIIMPIVDRDKDGDNEPDINKLKHSTIKIKGITLKIGSFIVALIRFIVLISILFIITMILLKMK